MQGEEAQQAPGAGVLQGLNTLVASVEMRLADALASGADLIQTAKIFEAGKFYTEPRFYSDPIADNRYKLLIDISKPLDLKSLQLGWSFYVAKSVGNAGLNDGLFTAHTNATTIALGASVTSQMADAMNDAALNEGKKGGYAPRLNLTREQVMRRSEICSIVPQYMLRRIRVMINGALIGEIPPANVNEEMPHWLTFVGVLFNVIDRPRPLSLDSPGLFFPTDATGNAQPVYHWYNSTVKDCIQRYDMDAADGYSSASTKHYYARFPLGAYLEQQFGHPVRWLTWGNTMQIEVEFQDEEVILEYCLSRNPSTRISTAAFPKPKFKFGSYGYCTMTAICDQNAEIFNELNDLVVALSPLVYRRPWYDQRIQRTTEVNRSVPFSLPFQTQRRPRFIIVRALQFKPAYESTDTYKNYNTPWQYHWIPVDKVRAQLRMTYLSQSYYFRDIRFDHNYGDGSQGTWHMFNQFQEIVGIGHHVRGEVKPISYYEFMSSWPCFIFRLDQAPASAILLDRKQGFGTETLQLDLSLEKDSSANSALNDDNVHWVCTIVADDMTTLNQMGQMRYNQRPDQIEPFSSATPIANQRVFQIAVSGNLINLLNRLQSMPTNPGSMSSGYV